MPTGSMAESATTTLHMAIECASGRPRLSNVIQNRHGIHKLKQAGAYTQPPGTIQEVLSPVEIAKSYRYKIYS